MELRKFPIDAETGDFQILYPTRLGNLIRAYEEYPKLRYGMDAIFYWYRIWMKIDDNLKNYLDSQLAIADSVLYSSFSFYVSGFFCLIYAISAVTSARFNLSPIGYLPHYPILFVLFIISFAIGYFLYRLSTDVHSNYGELFKSMFDVFGKEIDVSDVIAEVHRFTSDPIYLFELDPREKYGVAWRYLHNYRIRCKKCKEPIEVPKMRHHTC
ncbi:MAG: hypothetical protein WBD99_14250 [Thermodesulfobacteriota bacterium]